MAAAKRRVALVAFAVVAVGLSLAWSREQPTAVLDSSHPVADRQDLSARRSAMRPTVVDLARAPDKPAAAPTHFKPMPPVNTPLHLAYRQIKEQSDAGDPVARCRLASEIERCGRLPERVEASKNLEPRLKDNPNREKILGMMRDSVAADAAVCQDFTPDPDDQPWRLMLQSALSGNHTAALQFALNAPGLDPKRPLATLEGWEAYADYAPRLLQQVIADGDSRGYQVAAAFGRIDRFGAKLVPDDPVQIAAYYLALIPRADATYRPGLQRALENLHLNESDLARAQTRAAPLAAALKPPPDGLPIVGNNIVGYGKWTRGEDCEH